MSSGTDSLHFNFQGNIYHSIAACKLQVLQFIETMIEMIEWNGKKCMLMWTTRDGLPEQQPRIKCRGNMLSPSKNPRKRKNKQMFENASSVAPLAANRIVSEFDCLSPDYKLIISSIIILSCLSYVCVCMFYLYTYRDIVFIILYERWSTQYLTDNGISA